MALGVAGALTFSAAPAEAHHRCGHKRTVCPTPRPADTGGTTAPPTNPPPPEANTAPTTEPPATDATTGGATPPSSGTATPDTSSGSGSRIGDDTTTGGTTALVAGSLTDAEAALRVLRNGYEPRPGNQVPNGYIPSLADLEAFRTAVDTGSPLPQAYRDRISGSFSGTTDEILQWGALKWGLNADLLKAIAVTETGWNQLWVGDNGYSYGLMQIKRPTGAQYAGWNGSHPLSGVSSAFNVDFYGSVIRACYEGAWGHTGDLWGCVGSWYSGGWHDQGAENYIASVKRHLAARTWEQPGY